MRYFVNVNITGYANLYVHADSEQDAIDHVRNSNINLDFDYSIPTDIQNQFETVVETDLIWYDDINIESIDEDSDDGFYQESDRTWIRK